MSDITTDIEDLDIEDTVTPDEGSAEQIVDHEGDEIAPGHEDRLSEAITERIRTVVPRHALYAGEAGNGYIEVHLERPMVVDDQVVDSLSVGLVNEDLADRASTLRGYLAQEVTADGRIMELAYTLVEGEKPGFLYHIQIDGLTVKTVRHSALAYLIFQIVMDQPEHRIPEMIRRVITVFFTRGVAMGQDKYETVTEDFADLVAYEVASLG